MARLARQACLIARDLTGDAPASSLILMTKAAIIAALLALLIAVPAAPQAERLQTRVQPPAHTAPYPDLAIGETRKERRESFRLGPQMERGIPARDRLDQRRRLTDALAGLEEQRRGEIDAYVVSIALDSDPVFAREARETGRVLSARFDAGGRTLTLAGPDGRSDEYPRGSIDALIIALARIAEIMDRDEDVLVLYTTSHGLDLGLAYHYGDTGFGVLSPARLASILEELGVERRVLILSACYSGVFVPALASPDTAILTAAAANRTSFGCTAENDWTFFGDALVNNALRQPVSLEEGAQAAARLIARWESERGLLASLPQVRIGSRARGWLGTLEGRMPAIASAPVGRPSIAP